MIRVVMFDLGLTLIDDHGRPFPHVKESLASIQGFVGGGKPVQSCLVSDFKMPAPPPTPAKIKALFEEYLQVFLEPTGLRSFFEPVQKRITLSTHAGAVKPDRHVFTKALERLGTTATLDQCLFITEKGTHVDVARNEHGMQTLLFREPGANRFDFDDWSQAPLLVAHLIEPGENGEAAVKTYLSGVRGLDDVSVEPTADGFTMHGRVWRPISGPGLGELEGVHVSFPVEGHFTRGPRGAVEDLRVGEPSTEQLAEAASFVRSLVRNKQIGPASGRGVSRPTHEVAVDEQGRRRLVRKRFTAL
ncbi:MAG TPA: hypothetical protein VK548_29210 [Candidatus Acidoferrum sp.]|nr:hypothetical protein [Candidatus Acidoferrum sp.]